MYPIHFKPIYQDYIWGGDRIRRTYRPAETERQIAESWEISDRPEQMSRVENGPFKDRTLHELVDEFGEKLLGQGQKFDRFPLLLKIIDAKETLSIQVHPDERSAPQLKGEPKTEMWIALEESSVLAGFRKGVEKEEFLKGLHSKHPESLLEKIELRRGESVYIPGGRVHAICGGSLLFEVQQNSNTTYRIHDWGRKGKDGKPRPLHLDEAMIAIDWYDKHLAKTTPRHLESDIHHQLISLAASPFFAVEKIDVFDHLHVAPIPKTFQIFFCMKGEGTIAADGRSEPFLAGMTYLIPAVCGSIELNGKCEALRIRLP